MARGTGTGSIFKRGRLWWCRVYVDGKPVDESSKSTDYEVAKRHLAKLNGLKARGELGGRNARLNVNGLLDHLVKCLKVRERPETLKIHVWVIDAHLRDYF